MSNRAQLLVPCLGEGSAFWGRIFMVVNNLNLQHEVIWVVPCWLMAAAVQQGGDAEGYGGKASVN